VLVGTVWEALHLIVVPRCPLVCALFRLELAFMVGWTMHWTFAGQSDPYAWCLTVVGGDILMLIRGPATW
jgi:hypothetical protein